MQPRDAWILAQSGAMDGQHRKCMSFPIQKMKAARLHNLAGAEEHPATNRLGMQALNGKGALRNILTRATSRRLELNQGYGHGIVKTNTTRTRTDKLS